MYKLHEIYKNQLKPNNRNIDKKIVIDYFNKLHPAQQMFVINYNKETAIKSEESEETKETKETKDIIMNNETFVVVN